jgi:nuclear pore complex protein Nup160
MFQTAKFSRNVIVKALQLFMRVDGRNLLDIPLEELRSQISTAVENQVQKEASSFEIQHDEYRQLQLMCWSRFYEGCKQYAKMDNEPIGLFEDLETGLLSVVKRASVSFIRPCEPLESIFTYQLSSYDDQTIFGDEALGNDVSTLIMCACAVNEQMAQQQLDVDLSQMIGEVRQQIEQVADAILSFSRLQSLASENFIQRLQSITSIGQALSLLIERLDGNQQPLDSSYDYDGVDDIEGERRLVCSQLFSSYLGISVLSRAFTQIVDVRLHLCVSLAVVTQIAITLRQKVGISLSVASQLTSETLPQLLTFSCMYHSLHWISQQECMQASMNAMEANLRHLAALNLSDMIPSGIAQSEQPLSLLKCFLLEVGGRLRLTVIQSAPLSPSLLTGKRPYWIAGISVAVNSLLHLLWPDKQELVFGEFLMAQCQYAPLQIYLDLLSTLSLNCSGTMCFLRGQSLLHCGELTKAYYWFMKATHSLDEPCLLRMASDDDTEMTVIKYYAKLMQIYEQVSASGLIVQVTSAALLIASREDENTPIFWSGKFKHLLELNNIEGAYTAMISNPDPVRRKDCLRRFIVVLCECGRVKELCSFPYVGLQDEVVSLIELRARSSDLSNGVFYDLLYSFHITRRSFRRAAFAMYEYATRLAHELNDLQSLQKQGKCYLAAMNALRVVEKKSAWIVRPSEWDVGVLTQKEMTQRHCRRRRGHSQASYFVCVLYYRSFS